MSHFVFDNSPYPIRDDIGVAYREYWNKLAQPGNWFTGAERVAIAQETRNAVICPYCAERKQALSPYNFPGEHLKGDVLDDRVVDAVHRIITDQSRITAAYVKDNAENGFSEEQYIEAAGIAVTVFSIDEFNRALGLPLEPLPEPQPGEPDHYRPAHTEHDTGFVAMIPPDGATGNEADLWPPDRTANVVRALSLVPDALRGWVLVSTAQYLSFANMRQFTGEFDGRSIDRMQMELVAGRVSSVNECFY